MKSLKGQDLVRELLGGRDALLAYILRLSGDRAAAEEIFRRVAMAVVREAAGGAEIPQPALWLRSLAYREWKASGTKAPARAVLSTWTEPA